MDKQILTEAQLRENIVSILLINEIALTREQAEKMLDEGFLDKIKSGLRSGWESAKGKMAGLGSITKGGKYFGKGKAQAAADKQMGAELKRKGNKTVKDLDNLLKTKFASKDPKSGKVKYFPNNPGAEGKEMFIKGVEAIAQVYESIVAATKLKPGTKGHMGGQKANNLIKTLRMYVQKLIDYELSSVYRMFNESDQKIFEKNKQVLLELREEIKLINEAKAKKIAGPLTGTQQTETEKVYRSNVLPGILAGLGAMSWIASTGWFQEFVKQLLGAGKMIQTPDVVKQITSSPSSKGMLDWMGQIAEKPMKTGADVQEFINKFGPDKVQHMFDGNGAGPSAEQMSKLQQLVGGDNASKPVGDIFTKANETFGNMKGGQNLFGVSKSASFVANVIVKKGLSQFVAGKGTVVAAKLAGLSGVLMPLGIGLVAAGALVKGLRMKGLSSSRMATLKKLLMSLNDVPVTPAQKGKSKKENNPKEQPPAINSQFYFAVGGKQTGPFTIKQIQKKITSGEITEESLAWKQGMKNWSKASKIAELKSLFSGLPPKLPQPVQTENPGTEQFALSQQPTINYQYAQAQPQQPATSASQQTYNYTVPSQQQQTAPAQATAEQPAKVTKKAPKKSTKKKEPTQDYARNQIGFNKLNEAFKVLIKHLNNKRII